MSKIIASEQRIAAVDLGSNSFHMIVVTVDALGHVRVLDRLREPVRLGSGLDDHGNLSLEAKLRALSCLERFGERIRDFSSHEVAAVGTNTLRMARNARSFLDLAEDTLGHPISVISGREEARLIYLGVSHSLSATENMDARRFVMDIGGGSTELIIGQGYEALTTESLRMGCVSSSQRFFPNGTLEKSGWKEAITAAHLELMPIQKSYRDIGWEVANGASGTIKSVEKVIQQNNLAPFGITLEHMYDIQARMISAKSIEKLQLAGLSEDRKAIFAGGLAILISAFEALDIKQMLVSEGALREGLVYERINRLYQDDPRGKAVLNLQSRFQVDVMHAQAVRKTVLNLFDTCQKPWKLAPELREVLAWSADLHEIGLAVSHSGYHKHGGYLLDNFDLTGFSTEEQHWLSLLVRTHRRKIFPQLFEGLEAKRSQQAIYLSVLLRLAVLLHRDRSGQAALSIESLEASDHALDVIFVDNGREHPLLFADLDEEKKFLKGINFRLKYAI
jgi:exopolyphosphatase/guanosine-5'-triphosphate,3'-diphosphate pyrophosphatase